MDWNNSSISGKIEEMKPSLTKILKIFRHEGELGYEDRAVIGGLGKLVSFWENEARTEEVPEEIIQAVCDRLRGYQRLSTASRREVLQGLVRRIQRYQEEDLSYQDEKSEPFLKTTSLETISTGSIEVIEPEKEEEQLIQQSKGPSSRRVRDHIAPIALDAPVTVLPGVGPANAKILNYLGIKTLGDMLYYFPRRYDDYATLKPINKLWYGEEVTVIGTVKSVVNRRTVNGKKITEAVITDGSGDLRVTWFNQPWKADQLRQKTQVVLAGKIDQYLGRLTMTNPECDFLDQKQLNTNRIVPVYPLAGDIKQRKLRQLMDKVINYWAVRVPDPLPFYLLQEANLIDLQTALLQIHFPDSMDELKAARQRLAFDEIFFLQLGVLSQKRSWMERQAAVYPVEDEWLEQLIAKLPYSLTGAQLRVLQTIREDLSSGRPMNRLLQGDVGSGKTILAAMGLMMVIHHGAQTAIMAPTSILAEQHYKTIKKIFVEQGLLGENELQLLVGATPEAEKNVIREGLLDGTVKLVVGTHALLEEPIQFANLQMAVIDEQHRFGVNQRAMLRKKGSNPHLLVMTATPIPRSLALTIYGDLDLSVLDEIPPGRKPVETYVLYPTELERAYTLIRSQIEKGRQAFIIYPLIEESEVLDVKAAVDEYERLQREIFPEHRLALLHGRMKPEEKDEVMARFRDGETQILVSTSVVEVGVDVPNATVMLIEGADRFGLAQLHQFRGRVGRGAEKSYCILIPSKSDAVENERLKAMAETNDGFVLAEKDLAQRGPGEFLGKRQSGYTGLRFANLSDVPLIEKARFFAQKVYTKDPQLSLPEHSGLRDEMQRYWGKQGDVS